MEGDGKRERIAARREFAIDARKEAAAAKALKEAFVLRRGTKPETARAALRAAGLAATADAIGADARAGDDGTTAVDLSRLGVEDARTAVAALAGYAAPGSTARAESDGFEHVWTVGGDGTATEEKIPSDAAATKWTATTWRRATDSRGRRGIEIARATLSARGAGKPVAEGIVGEAAFVATRDGVVEGIEAPCAAFDFAWPLLVWLKSRGGTATAKEVEAAACGFGWTKVETESVA